MALICGVLLLLIVSTNGEQGEYCGTDLCEDDQDCQDQRECRDRATWEGFATFLAVGFTVVMSSVVVVAFCLRKKISGARLLGGEPLRNGVYPQPSASQDSNAITLRDNASP